MKFRLALLIAALACTGSAAHADLIQNGGFETGTFAHWTAPRDGDVTGGTQDGLSAYDGQYYAQMFNSGGLLDQNDITDKAGQQLTLTFYLASVNITGFYGSFSVSWNGILLAQVVSGQTFGWTKYSYTVMSTGADQLAFEGNQNYGSGSFWGIDDVSLTPPQAVPEPSSLVLLGTVLAGLAGFAALRRRRKTFV